MGQVVRGHALQHGRRCRLEIDGLGKLHELRLGHDGVLGVRAANHRVGDAVARRDERDVASDRFDGSCRLAADGDRRVCLVEAGPEVDVDEVDAARGDAHERLPGPRGRRRHVDQLHRFRTAGFLDVNGFHSPLRRSTCRVPAQGSPPAARALRTAPNNHQPIAKASSAPITRSRARAPGYARAHAARQRAGSDHRTDGERHHRQIEAQHGDVGEDQRRAERRHRHQPSHGVRRRRHADCREADQREQQHAEDAVPAPPHGEVIDGQQRRQHHGRGHEHPDRGLERGLEHRDQRSRRPRSAATVPIAARSGRRQSPPLRHRRARPRCRAARHRFAAARPTASDGAAPRRARDRRGTR